MNNSTLKIKLFKISKEIVSFILIFVLIYSVLNWWRQPEMPDSPVLQLQDYQGQVIDLQQLSQDNAVLIYFWGSWCHVCKHTTPTVQQLAHSSPVVSIAVQSGNSRELSDYLRKNQIGFQTVNDEHGEIFATWQGQVTPSYLILKDGKMEQGFVGIQPLWILKLRMWWADL